MRYPCYWMKDYLVWSRQNEGSEPPCSTQLQLFQSRSNSTTKSFSIFAKQSTYHGSEDKKEQAISWAADRSNLVQIPASSWHVTVAKGGETKAYLPNFSCAIRSRKRLVQSNSTLNTLFPSDSNLMVLSPRGSVQWTFPLWICLGAKSRSGLYNSSWHVVAQSHHKWKHSVT